MKMANEMLTNSAMNLAVIGPAKDDKDIREALNIR